MRDLVDGEKQILVRSRANDIANHPELPRPERCVAQEVRAGELEGDDECDDVLGERLGAAELRDLPAEGDVSVNLSSRRKWWIGGECTSGCALMMASRLVLCGSSV